MAMKEREINMQVLRSKSSSSPKGFSTYKTFSIQALCINSHQEELVLYDVNKYKYYYRGRLH